MNKSRGKRGDILIGDVIFLVLNLVFLTILILFVVSKTNDAARLEELHAKQIALMIDSAKPVMEIKLDMEKAKESAEENKIDFGEAVSITGNIVKVKLSQKGGYEYSFFNDVQVKAFPEVDDKNEYTGIYIFTINNLEEGK